MAEAFEAVRAGPGGFEQRVCIKRVLPGYSTDEDFVRLFLREARLAAALSHRNITRVVDFGEDAGCHYLALELVDGIDLRRLLRATGRPLPPGVVALVGMEVAEALDHAHNRGGKTGPVIHRDISPANILASVDGDVKLTDFGISKALNDAAHTRSELVRGNLWYMAPEQLDGTTRSDPRSDLFSLGVVLYELLAGRRPYDGPTDVAAMRALSEGRRTPLVQAAPDVPAPLAAVVEHLLAHRPDDRPPSAAAVAEALAAHTSVVARERRELAALVREHRHHVPKRRAVALAPITEDLREASRAASPAQASAPPASPARHRPPASPTPPPPPVRPAPLPASLAPSILPHAPPPPVAPRPVPSDPTRAAPAAVGSTAHAPSTKPPQSPRPSLPPRWQRYAFAPGTWASADRAAAQRQAEGRPLHPRGTRAEDPPPELPRSPALWLTLAAGLATCIALGSCFFWALT